MSISLTRLSGGNTPADGSDPRTFPAIWNASATAIEGALADTGASVTVSETAPVSPTEGDLWLNSTEAKMYVYYDDGTSEQWVAAVGGTVPSQGKILQVVQGTDGTGTTTTSTSYGDTGLSASITPSATTSKILVLVSESIRAASSSLVDLTGNIALLRDATQLNELEIRIKAAATSGEVVNSQVFSISYLDSPASTSALTYKTQSKSGSTSTSIATDFVGTSTITLMEVAG